MERVKVRLSTGQYFSKVTADNETVYFPTMNIYKTIEIAARIAAQREAQEIVIPFQVWRALENAPIDEELFEYYREAKIILSQIPKITVGPNDGRNSKDYGEQIRRTAREMVRSFKRGCPYMALIPDKEEFIDGYTCVSLINIDTRGKCPVSWFHIKNTGSERSYLIQAKWNKLQLLDPDPEPVFIHEKVILLIEEAAGIIAKEFTNKRK